MAIDSLSTRDTIVRVSRMLTLVAVQVVALEAAIAQVLPLPRRAPDAPSRAAIIQTLTPLSRAAREDSVFRYVVEGNVPDFIRQLVPVTSAATIGGTPRSVTTFVTPDYFALGSDDEYFLIPMTPLLAQRIADALRCILPTRKMVNGIYAAAGLKLAPAPIPPSDAMTTVPVFAQHDSLVWTQRAPHRSAFPLGTLVGGTKKDVVISNKIRQDLRAGVPKPVVIYGWHQVNGVPIQPLYNGHGETYADYSHGIRLVLDSVMLDGAPGTVTGILQSTILAPLLSDEGVIPLPRYGDTPTDAGSQDLPPDGEAAIIGNFPNPFNPRTTIRYSISELPRHGAAEGVVRLVVRDLLGRDVAMLVNELKAPGTYNVLFDASSVSSGIYFYTLSAGSVLQTRTMLVVK